MLTVLGPSARLCDGVTRRGFLQVGSLALGGLTLPGLMRAEAAAGKKSHKSVIMVYLSGGLAHQDTFDLKPNAPAEIRGQFKPIATSVPGIQIGEMLPRLASCADKLILLRSLVGLRDEHSSFQSMTGFTMDVTRREGKPHAGSVIAKMLGQADPVVPPFVDLFPTMQHKPYNSPAPGMLGQAASPAKLDSQDLAIMKLNGITSEHMNERRKLWQQFDQLRRDADRGERSSLGSFYERAFDVLTSNKLVEALDLTREPEQVRERYGRGSPRHM